MLSAHPEVSARNSSFAFYLAESCKIFIADFTKNQAAAKDNFENLEGKDPQRD